MRRCRGSAYTLVVTARIFVYIEETGIVSANAFPVVFFRDVMYSDSLRTNVLCIKVMLKCHRSVKYARHHTSVGISIGVAELYDVVV